MRGTWGIALVALLVVLPGPVHAQMMTPVPTSFPPAPTPGVVVFDFAEGLAGLQLGRQYGYINRTGAVVIPPQFDDEGTFAMGLAPVAVAGKWGYIDSSGTVVVPLQFDAAGRFAAAGLAPVKIGGKWGFIDRSGALVIAAQFDNVDEADDEALSPNLSASAPALMAVKLNGKWGYGDATGRLVIAPQFDDAHHFTGDGVAAVAVADKWGFINPMGAFVVPPRYDDVTPSTNEGFAAVKSGNRWGFVQVPAGTEVIMPRFTDVDLFSGGLAPANLDGQWGYIDPTGRFVIPAQFANASRFLLPDVTFVQMATGAYTLIDRQGNAVSPAVYEDAGEFMDGIARVQMDGKVGFVDHTGTLVIAPQFVPDSNLIAP